jgi:hypothetical protein
MLRRVSFVLVLTLALSMLALPAQAYYLLGASVTPETVQSGDVVTVCFTLGDDNPFSSNPYEVEAYFGPKDASEFFNCGLTFGYSHNTPWHSPNGLWPPGWSDHESDINPDGMELIYQNDTWPAGTASGTEYCFDYTLPDLVEGQPYFIHLLVGYNGECDNWTHYTLPLTVEPGGGEPVVDCGITGTNALIENWQDNKLETTQPIGGVFYWVQFTTGEQVDSWSVDVYDPTPAGFELQKSGSAVQVYYDGVAVQNINGGSFSGTWMSPAAIPADTTVTLRVHYKWNKKIGTVPDTYTFGAFISDSDGEFTFECVRELNLIE